MAAASSGQEQSEHKKNGKIKTMAIVAGTEAAAADDTQNIAQVRGNEEMRCKNRCKTLYMAFEIVVTWSEI